jgi:NAD-dependent dihydropyrimidine dehydrogenase PreA subunit
MGRFVAVELRASSLDRDAAKAVVGACPVDIFTLNSTGELVAVSENEDECILCGRCVDLAGDAVAVRRCYGKERAVTAGGDRD